MPTFHGTAYLSASKACAVMQKAIDRGRGVTRPDTNFTPFPSRRWFGADGAHAVVFVG